MKWRNGLAALIGIWFIISPWVLNFANDTAAVWTSVVIGAIQLIVSAWATSKSNSSGWNVWQTWISLITGAWFIVQSFIYSFDTTTMWITLILGIVTMILNLWTMGAQAGKKQ